MPTLPPPSVVVAGLDLSLTGAGVAIIRADSWQQRLSHVRTRTFGGTVSAHASTQEQLERLDGIAVGIVDMLRQWGVTHVFVEGYSFGAFAAREKLGELGGVVKLSIYRALRITPVAVPPATARKLFLGHARKGSKLLVAQALKALNAPFKDDEGDAFVITNYGLADLGLPFMTVASQEELNARQIPAV